MGSLESFADKAKPERNTPPPFLSWQRHTGSSHSTEVGKTVRASSRQRSLSFLGKWLKSAIWPRWSLAGPSSCSAHSIYCSSLPGLHTVANHFTADKARDKSLLCFIFFSFKNVRTGKGGSWAEQERRETLLLLSDIPVSVGVGAGKTGETKNFLICSIKRTLLFCLE